MNVEKDCVLIRKPGTHKEDCTWKCKNAYEAEKLAKFLSHLMPHEVITFPESAWNDMEDYPNE